MKEIKLTNSSIPAIVDDEDYSYCKTHSKWFLHNTVCSTIKPYINLSNFVMRDYQNVYDHKDRNKHNNQKNNLRICTRSQNQANRAKQDHFKPTTSQYKGVAWSKNRGYWVVYISIKHKSKYLGKTSNEIEAAKMYDKGAKEAYGLFACLNFPEEKGNN